MTIYVDDVRRYPNSMIKGAARRWGNSWSHMWTDGDPEELHEMAEKLGLKRSYYQDHPTLAHYDITPPKRLHAILLGAQQTSVAEFIQLRN